MTSLSMCRLLFNTTVVVIVFVNAMAICEVVVKVGATCGSTGHHGIEARRRAWVDRFSSAAWIHDHPVGY